MSRYVYARLPRAAARERYEAVVESAQRDPGSLATLATTSHPQAAPVATGGQPAGAERVQHIRNLVLDVLEHFVSHNHEIPAARTTEFDRELGKTLHQTLEIVPGDAAHEGVWSFLTLVALPDVAYARFPEMHESRLLGTPRNVLRRTWLRRHVLGDLTHAGDPPLGEDEYVGIFERTRFARNPRLLRATARVVLEYRGSKRSQFLRDLARELVRTTGPLLLDVLDDDDLEVHVRKAAETLAPTSDE